MKTLMTISVLLFSSNLLAHPGHLPVESVHGFLHTEHIIALAVLGVIAFIADRLRDK